MNHFLQNKEDSRNLDAVPKNIDFLNMNCALTTYFKNSG